MKRCFYSKRNRVEGNISLMLCTIIGVCLISIGSYFLVVSHEAVTECGGLIVIGLLICMLGLLSYCVSTREYSITNSGIIISYLKTFQVNYPWSVVSQISICDINHAAKDNSVFDLVIRIVIGKEESGPTSGSGPIRNSKFSKWRTMEYHAVHFRTIINVEHSPLRLEEIRGASQKDIHNFLTEAGKEAIKRF